MKKLLISSLLLVFVMASTALGQSSLPKTSIDWQAKIQEAKKLLDPIPLAHSDKVSKKDFKWKEAALAVMDPLGRSAVIKIRTENKTFFCLTGGYFLNVEERPSGIDYNGKNTAFLIKNKDRQTLSVIGVKWLETEVEKILVPKGRKQRWVKTLSATPVLHVPYSTGLHQQELINAGDDYFDSRLQMAYNNLDRKYVKSLLHPSKDATEEIPSDWLKNLALIEQSDPREYMAFRNRTWKFSPYERVLVRLGANGPEEFQTRNYAGAVGLMQFTNNTKIKKKKKKRQILLGTWDVVRTRFPLARLPIFSVGSVDHVWSIEAAVLLHNLNMFDLVQEFGPSILEDPQLEYYLAAAYNGGSPKVIGGIKKYGAAWTRNLFPETRLYVEQLAYLHQHPVNPT